MPEGPEIRLAADRIADVLVGERIEEAWFAFPELKVHEPGLAGQSVTAIDTRGKAMLTRFEGGLTLYSHNQLYGRWYIRTRGRLPKTNRSLRVALHTASHSALLYSASDVDLLDARGLAEHPFLQRLGPDLLDPALTPDDLESRLVDRRFSGRSLAALYLDQGFLAGLGNYLRSEILFLSGLAPEARPRDCTEAQLAQLASDTLLLGWRSYRTRGLTLDEATREGLPPRPGGRRNRFWVFSRAGQACYRCGSRIGKEVRGSRRLYRCPSCQPPVVQRGKAARNASMRSGTPASSSRGA